MGGGGGGWHMSPGAGMRGPQNGPDIIMCCMDLT